MFNVLKKKLEENENFSFVSDKFEDINLKLTGLEKVNCNFVEEKIFKIKLTNLITESFYIKNSSYDKHFFNFSIGSETNSNTNEKVNNTKVFSISEPLYDFDNMVLSMNTKKAIDRSLIIIKNQDLIFKTWNLKNIIPNPKIALNFYGHPGTGKTMAAHAIAKELNKKIMCINYSQIESKYVGDGAKNIDVVFAQAQENGSVLFFDEADSLLGKRISNVTASSDQAINSLRSQLLIAIENFSGVVIFATNLIENYDTAFESRIKSIKFELPDFNARCKIWKNLIPSELPVLDNLNIEELSEKFPDFSGRDIRNAIIEAVTNTIIDERNEVSQNDFIITCNDIMNNKFNLKTPESTEKEIIKFRIKEKISISENA